MEAESLHTRRPAHFLGLHARLRSRASSRRTARGALALVAASAVVAPALLGVAATSSSAAAFTAVDTRVSAVVPAEGLSISVAPTASAILRPGEDLLVSVNVSNGSDETVSGAQLTIGLSDDTLSSSSELTEWLHPADDVVAASGFSTSGMPDDAHAIATIEVPPLDAGVSVVVPVSLAAASLDLDGSDWGTQGIVAALINDETVISRSRSATVLVTDATPQSQLSVVMPITTPASDIGLIPVDLLDMYTGPSGMLTRTLDAAINHNVALAIDPMIIASIRVLGTSAPASALEWLHRLENVGNPTFALPYADADVVAQAQAGVTSFLAPLSFDYAIDPARFSDTATPTPTPTSTPGDASSVASSETTTDEVSTPTPSPTDAAAAGVPTLETLLDWSYSLNGIVWPAPNTVSATTPAALSANGYSTMIVSSGNLVASDNGPSAASARVDGMTTLVADDELNSALRDALSADKDVDWQAAMARATAAVAVAAGESTPRTLLAALPREWPNSSLALSSTLAALEQMPFAAVAPITGLLAGAASDATLADLTEAPDRLRAVANLLQRETALEGFATALADPTTLTGPERTDLLALLSVGWIGDDEAWMTAVGEDLVRTSTILNSVQVVDSGSVLVVGGSAQFPVTVQNGFREPITVTVNLLPSNGRLVVDDSADVTIEAGSSSTVLVPVNAQVGNGAVDVQVTLTTAAGVQLGSPTTIPVNVQADWEGLGAALIGGAVLLFFGFGIFRNIRRRRRERAGEVPEAGNESSEVGADTHGEVARESGEAEHTSTKTNDVKPDKEVTMPDVDTTESPRG